MSERRKGRGSQIPGVYTVEPAGMCGHRPLQRLPVHLGRSRGNHVDRVLDRGLRRQDGPECGLGLGLQRGQLKAARLQGIRGENARPASIREHGHPLPPRDGLARQQHGRVEQLFECVDSDDSRLPEHGFCRRVAAGQRARVGGGRPGTSGTSPRLDCDDGLLAGHAPSGAGEATGVPKALQVEQHDVGLGVLFPVFQQVRGRDVRLVAHRHKGRHTDAQALAVVEDGHAEGSALRQESHAPAGGPCWGEGGVQLDVLGSVQQAEAVRSDQSHARTAHNLHEPGLPLGPLAAHLPKARRDDHQGLHPRCCTGLGDGQHPRGRHHQHREVDRLRQVRDGWPGLHSRDRMGRRMHRVDHSREAAAQQVAEDLVADGARAATRAHNGDGAGAEEGLERSGRVGHGTSGVGAPIACGPSVPCAGGRRLIQVGPGARLLFAPVWAHPSCVGSGASRGSGPETRRASSSQAPRGSLRWPLRLGKPRPSPSGPLARQARAFRHQAVIAPTPASPTRRRYREGAHTRRWSASSGPTR